MTREEAQDVLEGWKAEQASGLIALADGWPAVVGLAGILPLPSDPHGDLPDEVYDYFAEEVFQALEPTVREGLSALAVAPTLDRELARIMLGDEADTVIEEGLRTGILERRNGSLELHPLARNFLDAHATASKPEARSECIERCIAVYRDRRDWDGVFRLAKRAQTTDELATMLTESLDDLLSQARLATIQSLVTYAQDRSLADAVFSIAHAELCIRRGKHTEAKTVAIRALASDRLCDSERYRLLSVAGRAAHVALREDEALAHYREAEQSAGTAEERREARWAQAMCAAALELDEAKRLLGRLREDMLIASPRELIRMADKQLSVGFKFGKVDRLEDARRAEELLPYLDDPILRCSFQTMFAYALVLVSDYSRALDVSSRLLRDATDLRVELVLPFALSIQAAAYAGLRQFELAHKALDRAATAASECNDLYGLQNVYAVRVRTLLHEKRDTEACGVEPPGLEEGNRAMIGEILSSRGLALACQGRTEAALELAASAESVTQGVEARVLTQTLRAVVAARSRSSDLAPICASAVDTAFDSGATDLLVVGYRCSPELLDAILATPRTRDRGRFLLARAGDNDLAVAIGRDNATKSERLHDLSRREREIYDLVCRGLANRDIARELFISEATVKVHLQHVYDKVGVRSRHALALNAALDRARSRRSHDSK
jgi:DNA-binding NarL/FixJ family response regulator